MLAHQVQYIFSLHRKITQLQNAIFTSYIEEGLNGDVEYGSSLAVVET